MHRRLGYPGYCSYIYGINKWGGNFFKILDNGNLGLLNPLKLQSKPIDLTKIIKTQ